MKRWVTLGALIVFALLDQSVTTVLFGHGKDYKVRFITDVYLYNIYTSMIELWAFGVARTSLLLGGALGLAFRWTASICGFRRAQPALATILLVMWLYTMLKMLLFSEAEPDLRRPWFWSLFAWTNVAVIGVYALWSAVAEDKSVPRPPSSDTGDEEVANLVDSSEDSKDGGGEEDEMKKKQKESKTSSFRTVGRLLKLSAPDWYILTIAFIFMTLSSLAEVFIPYYVGAVIQGIAIEKSSAVFTRSIIIMSLLTVGSSLAAGVRGGCFKFSMARFQVRVCKCLFDSLMRQDIAFYDATRTGEITSRLTSDTTIMCEALSLNTNIFMRSLVEAVGICVFMFRLSWRLCMVSVMGLPLILGVSGIYGEFYKNLSKKVQDSLAKVNEVAEEACSSMRTVRSFANEQAEARMYADKLKVTFKLKVKESLAYAGYMWISDFFALALVVGTLYYGGHLVLLDRLAAGHLVSFILYQLQLGFCLESIAGVYTGLMQAVGASEKVFEFIDRQPSIHYESGKLKPDKLSGLIEFRGVTFSYPSRSDTKVLTDVSFQVKPGEVVALVGPSGGGKSTIVSLLEHFYETEEGQVLLDGRPIQDYDHTYLHTKVALVGQEPVLYARSVKENIAYGAADSTDEEVQAAARQANAHDFISEMKEKYDAQTGEKGMQLSGGQKQRIAIARALIRNPVVLLLDEATSALDAESEHVVQEAIYNNLKDRTVIIVAHRLSTVERADRIIVIEKGMVAEQGTHSELIANGGMYARLVRRQLLSFDMKPAGGATASSPAAAATSSPISASSFRSVGSENMSGSPGRHSGSILSRSPTFGSV